MAKYTTEVRSICETLAGYDERKGYLSVGEIISKSRSKIFNFEYPIFDNNYKSVLETKILKHYYGREIGAETLGRWQLWLDMRMNEIMPYYNKLYELDAIKFNPLYDVDYYKEGSRQGEKTGTEERNLKNNGNDVTTNDSYENTSESINKQFNGDVDKDNTGTITDVTQFGKIVTNNLNENTTRTGTESKSGSNVPKKSTWEEFSDTPQGALTDVRDLNYLTTAKHITEDGTGSTHSETLTLNTTTDTDNTGTVTDSGRETLTKTLDTNERTITDNDESISREEGSTIHSTTESEHVNNATENAVEQANTTEEYLHHVYGKMYPGSYAKNIVEYRDSLLNIDVLIINELKDLFMGLW